MKVFLSLAIATTCLLGCATTPAPVGATRETPVERLIAFQAKPVGPSGLLIVTRDSGFIGSGCFYSVLINGTAAARLDTGEKASFYIPAGEVLVRAGRDPQGKALCSLGQSDWTQRETVLRANETKHFRLTIDANGRTDMQRGEQ